MTYQQTCPDCGVGIGRPHRNECDVERCSVCSHQRITCGCEGHDPNRSVWTGEWPNGTEHVVDGKPSPAERYILDNIAEAITLTAMSCHEALRGYWERNDEGFEAMRDSLERALRLLGHPMPDYAARDREWLEENEPPEELDEDGITDTLRFEDFSFEQRPLSELPTLEELHDDFSGNDRWVDGEGEGGGLVFRNHIIIWQDEPLTDSDMLAIVEEQLERREEDRLSEQRDQITEELDRVNWIDGGF